MENEERKDQEQDKTKDTASHAPMWGDGRPVEPPEPAVEDNPASAPGWRDQEMPPGAKQPAVDDGADECMSAPCPTSSDRDMSAGEMMSPLLGLPPEPEKPAAVAPPEPVERAEPAGDLVQDGNISDLQQIDQAEPAPAPAVAPAVQLPDKPKPAEGGSIRAVGVETATRGYVCIPVSGDVTPPRELRVVGNAPPPVTAPPPPPVRRSRIGRAMGAVGGRLPGITLGRR